MFSGLEKKHIRVLNLVLIIMLGVSLGYLFSAFSGLYLNRHVPSHEIATEKKSLSLRKPSFQNYQHILSNNLFDPSGRNKPNSPAPSTTPQKERKSVRTDLVLLGTVTSRHRPIAVFKIKQEEHVIHLGGEIPGGGTVEEIDREAVRIRDENGSLYTLVLPGKEQGVEQVTAATSSANPGNESAGIKDVGENRWIISSQAAQTAKENMGEILKQARLVPEMKNGQVEGFKIVMIRPQTLLWNLGLKRGDVIREINGIQLDNAEKALQIYQQLKEARNISIGLQRLDENLSFEYAVE